MKKVTFILFILSMCATSFAQKQLSVEDISNPTDIYPCEDRYEMKAVFICDSTMRLSFVSNYELEDEKDILSFYETVTGNERHYELVFPTEIPGSSCDGRELTMYCDGFDKYVFPGFNGPAKTVKSYKVTNPYTKMTNPFYKSIDSASEFFNLANYKEALSQYNIAREAPEYINKESNIDIDAKIAEIDSIIKWREEADKALANRDYFNARDLYTKVFIANANDKYASDKLIEVNTQFNNVCLFNMNQGALFSSEDKYEEAQKYYQTVIDMNCDPAQRALASSQLKSIRSTVEAKKSKSHFFNYEFNKFTPIGFSVGKCNMKGVGGYFSLRTNADFFTALKIEPDVELDPEMNISFGWTRKIIPPVWIFFGPGYTARANWEWKNEDLNYENATEEEKFDKDNYKFQLNNAISPEIGIIVKYWYLNLKYTFQYRFGLSTAQEKAIGNMRHYISIGACW